MEKAILIPCPHCDEILPESCFPQDADELNSSEELVPFDDKHSCEDVAKMYRIAAFAIDNMLSAHKVENPSESDLMARHALEHLLKQEWGTYGFDRKFQRYLDLYIFGMTGEYTTLLQQIKNAYCNEYFYPALTAAGSLGERILNQLLLKTRSHFIHSPEYKKVFRKKSIDNWDLLIETLESWGIISKNVTAQFLILKELRHKSVHYNENHPFEENARLAIMTVAKIIELQFGYLERHDLFWINVVSSEIWVRSEMIEAPFVKEFVLPHCIHCTPFCEPFVASPFHKKGPPSPLTDVEFLKLRKEVRCNQNLFEGLL